MNVKNHKKEVIVATRLSVIANIFLFIIKLTFGIFGKSSALVADAIHSLSDLSTDAAILIGVQFWTKPPDKDHPHGHYKIETLVTLLIGIILAVIATALLINSLQALHHHKYQQTHWSTFIVAILSIAIKELLCRWTIKKSDKAKSMALLANAYHQRSDALSSMPVAISIAISWINPGWAFIDHVGAIFVTLFIFQSSFKILFPTILKLTDTGLSPKKIDEIQKIVLSVNGILGVHEIRSRYLGSSKIAIDLHIEIDGNISVKEGHDIYRNVKDKLLHSKLSIIDIIIHTDPYKY